MAKEWFQHDYGTRNKKKLAALIHQEGSRGYGLFWIIVEMLYEDSNKKMELEDYSYVAIRKESGEDIPYIKEFIEKCISVYRVFKKIGKRNFSTSRVIENDEHRRGISKIRSATGRKGGISRSNNLAKPKQNVANAGKAVANPSREEESRVDKSIEERATVQQQEEMPAPDLTKSNLFRKPVIPTPQQVLEKIINAGGTKEMAKAFWEKHQATGWFIDGSPIINFSSLASKFVDTWKRNDQDKKIDSGPASSGGPTLQKL